MKTVFIHSDAGYQALADSLKKDEVDREAEERERELTERVRVIVEAVRDRGDAAVAELTERFDKVALDPPQFEVSRDEMKEAAARCEPELLAALRRAHDNVQRFHGKNLRASWEERSDDGTVVGQRVTPIESAGVYVPGGTAFYPSSVLMNLVPAKVAGVGEIVMVSPPSYEGSLHPLVMAAAELGGATRVFRIGGAQAVAALAFGTETVPRVLKITGPGNIYVTLAKRLVSTVCDIDKEAGPSEVVVIADDASRLDCVALELMAQAEHDPDSRPYLVTPSEDLAKGIEAELARQLATLPRAEITGKALDENGVVYVVRDLDEAARVASLLAPEHLSVQSENPRAVFDQVHNAGCAALGSVTSVAMGDYYAGPNHILPTGRRARYASPLTAEDFRKVTSVIEYSPEGVAKAAPDVIRLAEAEGLAAHARAVQARQ